METLFRVENILGRPNIRSATPGRSYALRRAPQRSREQVLRVTVRWDARRRAYDRPGGGRPNIGSSDPILGLRPNIGSSDPILGRPINFSEKVVPIFFSKFIFEDSVKKVFSQLYFFSSSSWGGKSTFPSPIPDECFLLL